jgi:hypothetical protein
MCLLDVIHLLDGSISLGILAEANETEATAAAGVTILHDDLRSLAKGALRRVRSTYSLLDLTELLELGAKGLVVGVPGKASVVAG